MILTCPACTMRYIVSEGAIGLNGRRVRCASCGHQWMQEPETGLDEELFGEAPSFMDQPPAGEENDDALAFLNRPPRDQDDGDADFQSILRKEIESAPIPQGVVPDLEDPVLAQLVKDKKAKLPPASKVGGFVAAGFVWLVLAAVLLVFQPQISRAWPPSNMLYHVIGLKPVMPGQGLALDSLHAEMREGKIFLKGTIINLQAQDADVPAVMATIVGLKGEPIDQVLIAPPVSRLKGEGQAAFDVVYPKIPDGSTDVTFAFSFTKAQAVAEDPAAAAPEKVRPSEYKVPSGPEDPAHEPQAH